MICESDSLDAIRLINGEDEECHTFHAITKDIKDTLNRSWKVTLQQILREANFVADYLVKMEASSDARFVDWPFPSTGVVLSLLPDNVGISFPAKSYVGTSSLSPP